MPAMRKYGVYHFFIIGEDGAITSMYVGESHTATEKFGLHKRIRQHINPGGDETGNLADNLVRAGDAANRDEAVEIIRASFQLQYLVLPTPQEAISLEHYAISALMPRYNLIPSASRAEDTNMTPPPAVIEQI
jgi:excinuclease UvrABC nuclease subunit